MEYLVVVIIVVVIIILLSNLDFSPSDKGAIGERDIAKIIHRETLRGIKGKILQNIYLPTSSGGTTEIDILFICQKGLFVIESKNYAGYIFGDETSKHWTVSLYAGKNWLGQKTTQKHHFYNPIWQNRGHSRALDRFLSQPIPIYSLVVFSNRSSLAHVSYNPNETTVLRLDQLRSYFKFVRSSFPDCMTENDVDKIYSRLFPLTYVTSEVKQSHIDQVYQAQHRLICPRCGGALVLRTAKIGNLAGHSFYGCSNYPRCRYTQNLDVS